MNGINLEQLPEVSIYAIGPEEAEYAKSLLSPEAFRLIKNGEAFGMALEEEGQICAAICARLAPENEEVLEIISLFVAEEFRCRGLGITLVLELLDRMLEATDASLQFMTVSFLSNNKAMEDMLYKIGFEMEEEEGAISWQIPIGKIENSMLMKTAASLPENTSLYSLESLSNYQIRQLVQKLEENNVDYLSYEEIEQAHPQASLVLMDEKEEPMLCAIFSVTDDEHVTLSQFYTSYKSPSSTVKVLQAGARVLMEQFSEDAILEIPTLSTSSSKLVQRLLPVEQGIGLKRAVLDLAKV